jgi:membrane protein required for beta-lactamase induction
VLSNILKYGSVVEVPNIFPSPKEGLVIAVVVVVVVLLLDVLVEVLVEVLVLVLVLELVVVVVGVGVVVVVVVGQITASQVLDSDDGCTHIVSPALSQGE